MQRKSKIVGKSARVKSADFVTSHSSKDVGSVLKNTTIAKTGVRYWRERLLLRRYSFPSSRSSDQEFTVFVSHAGTGYFFPLGTADENLATRKAFQINRMVVNQGWTATCRRFPRELIVSFEWCMAPVLWTYTTIHTLVAKHSGSEFNFVPSDPNRQRVLVLELDAGIRRALCWSIDHQVGFASVPCDSPASFSQALALYQPRMVLLNRNLSGRIGFKSAGTVSPIREGLPAVTYSIYVDGDQMFVSTPGGAGGYLVKRVEPDCLLTPVLKVATRSELMTEDFLLCVKYYFQELLQLHSVQDNAALAKLTPREREVMELLSKGHVDKEIAQTMGISLWTVHGYIKNIFERLQVRTRTEAVIRYLEK